MIELLVQNYYSSLGTKQQISFISKDVKSFIRFTNRHQADFVPKMPEVLQV